jgi:hypothetical protein
MGFAERWYVHELGQINCVMINYGQHLPKYSRYRDHSNQDLQSSYCQSGAEEN